jgi:hypothetical protein
MEQKVSLQKLSMIKLDMMLVRVYSSYIDWIIYRRETI